MYAFYKNFAYVLPEVFFSIVSGRQMHSITSTTESIKNCSWHNKVTQLLFCKESKIGSKLNLGSNPRACSSSRILTFWRSQFCFRVIKAGDHCFIDVFSLLCRLFSAAAVHISTYSNLQPFLDLLADHWLCHSRAGPFILQKCLNGIHMAFTLTSHTISLLSNKIDVFAEQYNEASCRGGSVTVFSTH